MKEPQVTIIHGFQVRIWRSELIELTKDNYPRVAAVLEMTKLDEYPFYPRGLTWKYSARQIPQWSEYPYTLLAHFPGNRPCTDLKDVYDETTAEIRFMIEGLQEKEALILARRKEEKTSV
jgi:hypothetical protein